MKKALFILLILSLIICLPIITQRYRIETANRKVEICLDWTSFATKCQEENYPWEEFLLKIREFGVSSLGISEDNLAGLKGKIYTFTPEEREKLVLLGLISSTALPPLTTWVISNKELAERLKLIIETKSKKNISIAKRGDYYFLFLPDDENYQDYGLGYNPDKFTKAKNYGFKLFLRIDSLSQISLEIWDRALPLNLEENVSGIFFSEEKKSNFLGDTVEEFFEKIKEKKFKIALSEFTKLDKLKASAPVSLGVRMHYLSPDEYNPYLSKSSLPDLVLKRLVRAVKERNVRILYLYPLPNECIPTEKSYFEEQFLFLSNLKKQLEKKNFSLDLAEPFQEGVFYPERTKSLRKIIALAIACLFPFLGLQFCSQEKSFWYNFLLLTLFSLSAGILVSTLLSGNEFFLKLDEFRGTKFALVLPILCATVYLYWGKWRKIYRQEVHYNFLLILIILGLIFLIYIMRSSNQPLFYSTLEEKLRNFVENLFKVRPRIKEFLFGHPLLILGFYLYQRQVKHPNVPDYRPFLILGLIGQVSIVNTFVHLHIPLYISFLRTLYGLFLGSICGLALVKFYTVLEEKKLW